MFKKLIKGAIVGVGMLALAGAAQAEINVNLYGASAQYLFWNDQADNYLLDNSCTGVTQAQGFSNKQGITTGTCAGETVNIRYASKASFDGLRACCGQEDPGATTVCTDKRQREMADVVVGNVVTALACKDVTIGCSDVAWNTFNQSSHGALKGCAGGAQTDRNITPIDCMDGWAADDIFQTVVVPFGFFANNALLTDTSNQTRTDLDAEETAILKNLTRLQAVLIFSGQVYQWDQFGAPYPAKQIAACFRHAGSGTHATLDRAVLRGDAGLPADENLPYVSFNDGSSDEMVCIQTNCGQSASEWAAVGYADADQAPGAAAFAMTYQGAKASKANIVNGVYDFWSANWCYICTEDPEDEAEAKELMTYAMDHMPASKAAWWATQDEMNVKKASDFAYPAWQY